MGWRELFKRRESADEALLAVAGQQGWTALQASALAMLPPTHAALDLHGLRGSGAPSCAGLSFQGRLRPDGKPARISHLQITVSDEQDEVYDTVIWSRPPGTVPRFEVELGAAALGHHKLADRFGAAGAATARLDGGAVLHLARSEPAALARAWPQSPRWAAMLALATGELRGCVAEGRGDEVAVFAWTGMPRPGRQRWRDLLAVAQELESLIDEMARPA